MKGDDELLNDICKEVSRARTLFPSNEFMFPALIEEVGELAKALMTESADRIRAEAIQVACMAFRIASEGDTDITNRRFIRGVQP